MTLERAFIVVPEMHDFLAYFHIVLSLCILMRREDAIEAASILVFVLVQQLPLPLRILRLYLVGFLEAIQHPLLLLVVRIAYFPLLLILRHPQHPKRIGQEGDLDALIQRGVSVEGRRLIHLQQPWLCF